MTPAETESYRRQFEQAKKRLPRGHVIHSCRWQHGQLAVESRPAERAAPEPKPAAGRVQRGLFDTA